MSRYRVAMDIGGTFTDVVTYDEGERVFAATKASTTPGNLSEGVLAGRPIQQGDRGARVQRHDLQHALAVDGGGRAGGKPLITNHEYCGVDIERCGKIRRRNYLYWESQQSRKPIQLARWPAST